MGLEMVEIVIKTEDAFGIVIKDEEAERLVTVGQFYDLILTRLRFPNSGRCLNQMVFHELRRALTDQCGAPRESITPTANLASLLPNRRRRLLWHRLSKTLDLAMPRLLRPVWVQRILLLAVMAVGVFAVLCLAGKTPWTMFVSAAGAVVAFSRLTAHFANSIPERCQTVGGLVETLVSSNFKKLANGKCAWSEDEVWETLKDVVVGCLKVDTAAITRDAKWYQDLGAG